MGFSAFSRFNGGFRFSSRPPHGQRIYEALKASQGDTYDEDFSSRQSARLFAAAMSMAAAQHQIDRALNNANPLTAIEMLPHIERDFQIVPNYQQTMHERRVVADARRKVTRGARRESVESALRALLGDDFIAYETTEPADRTTWPAVPETVGAFQRPGAPKKGFVMVDPVSAINTPVTVAIQPIDGLDLPMPSEYYTVDPDSRNPHAERVTVAAATANSITATFSRAHARGAVAISPHPLWISNQRAARIVVTLSAATDPETRRKVNELAARMLRGVSKWFVCHDQGDWVLEDAARGLLDRTVMA